jgi:hypothetical protein
MMNYMADAQATANMFQVSDLGNLSSQRYQEGLEPSAECLAIDATSGIGMQQHPLLTPLVLYHKVI